MINTHWRYVTIDATNLENVVLPLGALLAGVPTPAGPNLWTVSYWEATRGEPDEEDEK